MISRIVIKLQTKINMNKIIITYRNTKSKVIIIKQDLYKTSLIQKNNKCLRIIHKTRLYITKGIEKRRKLPHQKDKILTPL